MSEDNFDSFEDTTSSTYDNIPTFLSQSQANGTTTFRLDKYFTRMCQIQCDDGQEELNFFQNNSNNLLYTFSSEFINTNIYESISNNGNTYTPIIQENDGENNFLGRMRGRSNIEEEEQERSDNMRTTFGSDFFNKYIKHKFEFFIKITKCGLCFESFPKPFYTEATHIRSQHYLDKTLEELIINKDLYKDDIISLNKYNNNLKVINTLKEDIYKNKLNENNFDNFLKKKYRDLIKDYSDSDEFERKIKDINKKKGKNKAKTFANVVKYFVEI